MNNQIIEMLKVNPSLRDLHNNGKLMRTVDAVVVFEAQGKQHVCIVIPGSICCLNPLCILHGEVVLKTASVGGLFDARERTLEEAVDIFNEKGAGKIIEIIDLKG